MSVHLLGIVPMIVYEPVKRGRPINWSYSGESQSPVLLKPVITVLFAVLRQFQFISACDERFVGRKCQSCVLKVGSKNLKLG